MPTDIKEIRQRIYESVGDEQEFYPRRKRRKKHSCLKFLIGLIFVLITILAIVFATIKFALGPAMKAVNGLPGDFPKDLTVYQANEAQIKIQTEESKEKIIKLIKTMPNWLAAPILNWLSENLQSKVVEDFGGKLNIPQNFTAEDLKKILESTDLKKIQAVSLSWENLNKTKEELAAYYKQKLAEADFQFKENLADYQIDLGFWKDGVFGTISLSDKNGSTSTDAEMKVNYLNDNSQSMFDSQ